MAIETTLSMIKPDGVEKNLIGEIYKRFEGAGLQIVAARMMHLTREQAEGFYAVHKERPFFKDLTTYMCTGPIITLVLARDNAVPEWRKLMGATNPKDADAGTIRKDFAVDIEKNSELAEALRVKGLPTLMIYKNGEMKWRQSGEQDANTLIGLVQEYV